jgi:hypothetical protein
MLEYVKYYVKITSHIQFYFEVLLNMLDFYFEVLLNILEYEVLCLDYLTCLQFYFKVLQTCCCFFNIN